MNPNFPMIDNILFKDREKFTPEACLRAMRISLLDFSRIHSQSVIEQQLPNAHESFFPVDLTWKELRVNVNDLFVKDYIAHQAICGYRNVVYDSRVIVLFGPTGLGKTALLNYLNYQWLFEAKDVKRIEDFDLAIVVNAGKLGYFRGDALDLLVSKLNLNYFPESMVTEKGAKKLREETKEELYEAKILWLFDDVDRANYRAKKLILDTIDFFPLSQFVLACHSDDGPKFRALLKAASINFVPLNFEFLYRNTWKPVVPYILRCKTYDPNLSRMARTTFIADQRRYFEGYGPIRHSTLGFYVNRWLEQNAPAMAAARVDPVGPGMSNPSK